MSRAEPPTASRGSAGACTYGSLASMKVDRVCTPTSMPSFAAAATTWAAAASDPPKEPLNW
ncbi:hypothetical protein ACVWYT_000719 [Streptomyces sp. TE4109]